MSKYLNILQLNTNVKINMKKSGILLLFLGLGLLHIAFYLQSSTESLLYST